MLKTVPIADLKPNPYRRLDEYEIIREKVDKLKQSIESTGFWGTIVGRPKGRFLEIAFGHHRLVALREMKAKTVDLIVKDLTNEQMLKMMANENLEEWGHSALVEIETIEATLEAAGKKEITLPPIPAHTNPNYIKRLPQDNGAVVYTMFSIAEFLGWTRENNRSRKQPDLACEMAFKAIDAMKNGWLQRAELKGLKRTEAWLLVQGQEKVHEAHNKVAERFERDAKKDLANAAKTTSAIQKRQYEERAQVNFQQSQYHAKAAQTKARDFGKFGSDKLRGGGGENDLKTDAKAWELTAPRENVVHEIDDLANKIADHLERIADGTDSLSKDFRLLRENLGDLSEEAAEGLRQSFAALITRLTEMKNGLSLLPNPRFVGTYSGQGPKALGNGR
jgi:hypothetical protein